MNSPAIQKMFQDLKFDVQTNKTGRTGMLNGIRADEFEMILSFELTGSHQTPAGFKMILQQWNDVMQKVFAQLPGLREKLRGPFEELSKTNGSLVLKMHMAAYRRTITKAGAEIIRRRRRS